MKTWPDSVEKKRAVLAEVNAFIARIMEKKKKTVVNYGDSLAFHPRSIIENEEGRDLMKRALQRRFPKTEKRKKDEPRQTSPSLEDNPPEERVLHQEINVPELKLILENPSGWSAKDLKKVKELVDAAPDDTLSVIYSRRYARRWCARGSAQL